MNPIKLLQQAVLRNKVMKWALGVAGLFAVVAIVAGFNLDYRVAVFGAVVVLVLMVGLLLVAAITELGGPDVKNAARLVLWTYTLLTCATPVLLFSSVFFGKPLSISQMIVPSKAPNILKVKQEDIPQPIRPGIFAAPVQHKGVPKLGDLREEYSKLYDSLIVMPQRLQEVDSIVDKVVVNKLRYQRIEKSSGVPWQIIAVLHYMECSLDFSSHLHNGDPLTNRTVNEPNGRPLAGAPPFTFESSAEDALAYEGFTTWRDWSIVGTCYKLESSNGFGYRFHETYTPYLWSGSQHYKNGKFVGDGVWSGSAAVRQIGAAVILKKLQEKGEYTPKL